MRTPREVQIDGVKYILGHWDVEKALETWAWLIESLGDGIGDLFKLWTDADKPGGAATSAAVSDEDKAANLNKNLKFAIKGFELVLRTLQNKVPPDVYRMRMMSFCTDVIGPSGKVAPKTEFVGRLLHMHKLAYEVLRYQYQDFFDEALSVLN